MKKYIFLAIVFTLTTKVFSNSLSYLEYSNHMIDKKSVILQETLLGKLQTALSTIYKSKKLKYKEFTLIEGNDDFILKGVLSFYGTDIIIESTFSSIKNIKSIKGKLKSGEKLSGRKFKFLSKGNKNLAKWFPKSIQKKISLDYFLIDFKDDSNLPSEIGIFIKALSSWNILESGVFALKNISGSINAKNLQGAKKISATLNGDFGFGTTIVKSSATVGSSSSDWIFKGGLQDLGLTSIIKYVAGTLAGVAVPDGVIDIRLKESNFSVIPAKKKFILSGGGVLGGQEMGNVELVIDSNNRGKLGFMAGITPSENFKMAKLDPNLKILDDLNITNFGMVLSSQSASKGNLKVFKKLGGNSSIGRGFNFIGAFDLSADGINLDELIGLKTVMIRAVVSNNLSDLLLEGAINTNINLGKAATFKKAVFRIKPSPANFKISMGGELEVKVDTDILVFKANMGIDITDQAIFVEGFMDNMWNEPFGAKGLNIGNLGATLEVSFRTTPIPLPAIGIKGELHIKEFKGDLLVFLNANNPSESAIDVGFNTVSLKSVLEEFCDVQTLQKIPQDIRNTVLNVKMQDVRVTVAARPITILEKDFDPGFRIKGIANIGDIAGANLDVQVGYDGIDASAGINKISHLPFFELKGALGKENPIIQIVAKADKASKVAISGSATLLGITTNADMRLNDKGFDLVTQGKIFNAFNAKLEVSGSRIKDGGSYRVAATMQQNFMKYVTDNASQEIDKATKKTQNDISFAQNKITKEQKKLEELNIQINKARNTVKLERTRDINNIKKARQAIANEKRNHFNDILNNIKSIQRKINTAHANIAKKKREIANANVFKKATLSLEYTPFFTKQAFIISTQETAKVAQLGYKEAANVALIAAEEAVRTSAVIGSNVPIDADPRIVALIGSKETANAAMEVGKGILEAAKQVGVGTLSAAKWIVENGPQNVINITYAHFETKLSLAHGKSITIHFKGTYLGKPLNEKFTINFGSPLESVQGFAKSLL